MEKRIVLEMSIEQANVVSQALNVLSRLGRGQLECIEGLLRDESIAVGLEISDYEGFLEAFNNAHVHLSELKKSIGFSPSESLAIGSDRVPDAAKRAFEIQRVLVKTLAQEKNPNPQSKGVDYEGVRVRYTSDVLASASVALMPKTKV